MLSKDLRWVACITLLGVPWMGCSGIRHTAEPYVLAGRPVAIEVQVPLKPGQSASGTVYYRVDHAHTFEAVNLLARPGSDVLSAVLPTRRYAPGTRIAYYIDLIRDGQPHALRSPANPYRVQLLTQRQLVSKKIRAKVSFARAGQPVVFTLKTGGLPVDHAVLTYQAPGLPGTTTAPMTRQHRRGLSVKIPGSSVQAGWWNYRIDCVSEGIEHSIPDDESWSSFEVRSVNRRIPE